ncbi:MULTISPECIES: helix-turn-helix domain-containing protein [unclassified Streptomyces]|uniref:helix-turn-helix domain-containing protein n=1 Tax=unclassified Streptomyces TaxID=2593676 RepID=UPI000DD66683|nr:MULTISPECIES: helix-turn-helix domain-containing protein [unclassified Streptomyces]QZZ27962.1 helix-turn-helix domain-containing protein [Streptomyces sp. ST1015]
MSRWQELPDSLDQRVRQLVVQLRRLKDRSGLSLVSLAAKTGYSRSSWERYLNGKALPPRQAVEELARVVGTDPTRLLVLHEVAVDAWQAGEQGTPDAESNPTGTAGTGPADPTATSGPPGSVGVPRPHALAAVVIAALLGIGAGLLIALPWYGDDDGDAGNGKAQAVTGTRLSPSPSTTQGGPGRYLFQVGKTYPCEVRHREAVGLGAGYSTTRTAVLAGPGWDVVEAQCLLRRHKLNPGPVDGVYGQQTIAAVVRLQQGAGLPADGVVGPHTWQVLRG